MPRHAVRQPMADGYRFSSLGMDIPLFHKAIPPGFEPDDTNINDPAKPFNVADRLRRRVLCDDIRTGSAPAITASPASLVVVARRHAAQPVSRFRSATSPGRGGVGQHAGRRAPTRPPSIPSWAGSRCPLRRRDTARQP